MKTPQTKQDATARPWKRNGQFASKVFDAASNPIADCCAVYVADNQSNAALIVKAVNEYEAFKALEEAVNAFNKILIHADLKFYNFVKDHHPEIEPAFNAVSESLTTLQTLRAKEGK